MEHFWSIFFLIGLLVVMAYAWQRFNEPSFPQRETLPRTVDPLRYLFLRSTYGKARWAYVAGLIVLYALFVAPGPTMIEALGDVGFKDFPPKAWALLVALVLTGVGVAPASVKWLNILEEWLRRWVHAWFLVPDGIERTIGVLEDARYDPPPSQLSLVESPATRERLQENLKAPTGTLRYRWARAGVLMVSLRQMGAGATHPLKRAAFEPFEEDFKAILASYRALRPDVEAVLNNPTGSDSEENLLTSVDSLLKRLYATARDGDGNVRSGWKNARRAGRTKEWSNNARQKWRDAPLTKKAPYKPDRFFIRLNKFSDRTCFCRPFSDVGGRRPLAHVQPSSFRLQM